MSGETDLAKLLKSMNPVLRAGEYIFCSIDSQSSNGLELEPSCVFREEEGVTLILEREIADRANISYSSTFRLITLAVHSSLEAVGFLAAIIHKLAEHQISVNAISAYYHDHLFVSVTEADRAMELLREFG